jgi:hypothetical protein
MTLWRSHEHGARERDGEAILLSPGSMALTKLPNIDGHAILFSRFFLVFSCGCFCFMPGKEALRLFWLSWALPCLVMPFYCRFESCLPLSDLNSVPSSVPSHSTYSSYAIATPPPLRSSQLSSSLLSIRATSRNTDLWKKRGEKEHLNSVRLNLSYYCTCSPTPSINFQHQHHQHSTSLRRDIDLKPHKQADLAPHSSRPQHALEHTVPPPNEQTTISKTFLKLSGVMYILVRTLETPFR